MKFLILLIIILIFSFKFTIAQNPNNSKNIYKAWIFIKDSSLLYKGLLYEINDSTITLSKSIKKDRAQNKIINKAEFSNISVNKIDVIKLRKTGKIINGILIGAITGITIGSIWGYSKGESRSDLFLGSSAKEKAMVGGVIFGQYGSIIGALIWSFRINIPINGDIENYYKTKKILKDYSIK